MIPIENSIAGRVADIHSLLPASGLHIVGETFLPIHFQLLAVPGARIEDLKTVHSHAHALGQCRNIIRRHKLQPVVAGDTAGAAREIAEWADKSRAALAPRLAGEIYGLETLASDVEDEKPQHDPLRRSVERRALDAGGRRAGGDDLRLSRPQRAGRALQGARRLRHQRGQHDQARKLHGRRRVHRHPVPRRRRRPPEGSAARAGARGAQVLLPRSAHSRRLSRPIPSAASRRVRSG